MLWGANDTNMGDVVGNMDPEQYPSTQPMSDAESPGTKTLPELQ